MRYRKMTANSPVLEVVVRQIDAYNARDLAGFLGCFSPEAEVFRLPESQPDLQGTETMEKRYGEMFAAAPELVCRVEETTVSGEYVVLKECISGMPGSDPFSCLGIYQVEKTMPGKGERHGCWKIRRLWLSPRVLFP